MKHNKKANRDLADYLYRRLVLIQRCNSKIENKFRDDRRSLCRKIDKGDYSRDDPAIGQIFFDLEFGLGNTFRYSMLLGVCSYLEEGMKGISKRFVSDYTTQLRSQKKGNWLHKHIHVLSDSVGLDVAPIQTDLDTFHDLITLRNCIAHAWGKVTEARDPNAVKAAAKRVETSEVSKDEYLVLGDQVVPGATIAAENIVKHILTSKLIVAVTESIT